MEELKNAIERQREICSGTSAVIVRNLTTGERVTFREREVFPAASLIKLPILFTLYKRKKEGLFLGERVRMEERHKVSGFGILKDLEPGLALTWKDLAVLMITVSDNTAANWLIDFLGMDAVNREIEALGLSETELNRKMMDAAAKERGLENKTSAADMERMYEAIRNDADSEEMTDILRRQQCNNKLPVFFGEHSGFAHKTGDLPGTEHDAGILYMKGQAYFIAVLTKDLEDNRHGIRLNQEAGRLVYEYAGQEKKA